MKITRVSPLTGRSTTLDINISDDQLKEWENGGLIQDIMPNLTADEREFIISGCTPSDFDVLFPPEEQ